MEGGTGGQRKPSSVAGRWVDAALQMELSWQAADGWDPAMWHPRAPRGQRRRAAAWPGPARLGAVARRRGVLAGSSTAPPPMMSAMPSDVPVPPYGAPPITPTYVPPPPQTWSSAAARAGRPTGGAAAARLAAARRRGDQSRGPRRPRSPAGAPRRRRRRMAAGSCPPCIRTPTAAGRPLGRCNGRWGSSTATCASTRGRWTHGTDRLSSTTPRARGGARSTAGATARRTPSLIARAAEMKIDTLGGAREAARLQFQGRATIAA